MDGFLVHEWGTTDAHTRTTTKSGCPIFADSLIVG
jgi:hypothetical protein